MGLGDYEFIQLFDIEHTVYAIEHYRCEVENLAKIGWAHSDS